MKKFLIYGVLPSAVVYIIACMVDLWAGVCTDRVLFILIFNSVFILPLCCVRAMAKKCTDIKKCFKVTLILPLVFPCVGLYTYLYALDFKITIEQLVFAELFFALLSYMIIIPGWMLVLHKKSQHINRTAKNVLSGFMAFVIVAEAVLGVILIISADEWQIPYEKYELSGGFSPENEGYILFQENDDALIYEKKLRGGRTIYCKVYGNDEKNSITVEKWGYGKD